MNNQFIQLKSLKNALTIELSLLVFGLTLPLSTALNNLSIALIVIVAIIKFWKEGPTLRLSLSGILIIFYFSLEVVSIIYSEHKEIALLRPERHLILIIIPIAFSIYRDISYEKIRSRFSTGFIAGNFCLASIFIYRYIQSLSLLRNNLNDSIMEEIAPMHASYFSLYLASSIILIIFINHEKESKIRYLKLLLAILFLCCIILSGSKSGILFILIIAICFLVSSIHKKSIKKTLIISASIFVLLMIVSYHSQLIIHRVNNVLSTNLDRHPERGFNTLSGRVFFWDCSLRIIKESPILGVGTGDSQPLLDSCYKQKEPLTITDEFYNQYNAHNQFLQTTIELGILGAITLVLIFALSIKQSLKFQAIDLIAILLITLIFALFESIFMRNKGIIFLTFILWLIDFSNPKIGSITLSLNRLRKVK